MKKNEWKLLEPFKLGNVILRNRMVLPPMETRAHAADGSVRKVVIDYYAERAKGGVGAIIIENTFIDNKAARSSLCSGGIYSDQLISSHFELAEAIKGNGAAAIIQISHGGRQCEPGATGLQPVAPSAIPCKVVQRMPRELTIEEIEEIQDSYAEAARRVKWAGFDAVELHGAHGYLLHSFLSPYINKRTDKYGGGLENRANFGLEVLKKVREKVGDDFIVGYRMSADDYIPGGLTLEETSQFAAWLEKAGIDYIHVSCGTYETRFLISASMYMERANLVHLAEGIKKAVSVPVIAVGALDIETAERVLEEEKADLVALGRVLIADPELPNKLAEGRIEDVRPCIRGNEGCMSTFDLGRPMRCEVNPACCREADLRITPAIKKKQVVVVGGGIAGMEATRVAALRGHDVVLVEKEGSLGGHLVEATVPQFKKDTKRLLEWAINQVNKSGADIRLNTGATPALIEELEPEVLIIAVGSDYIIPSVTCSDNACTTTAVDVLLGRISVGDHVVVVGAGFIGCETALYIAEELGKEKVTIIEMLDEMLIGAEDFCKHTLTERLNDAGAQIYTGWNLWEIKDKSVVCIDDKWKKHEIMANTVVLATGLGARKDIAKQFKDLAPETYIIGDCNEARRIYNAFEEAWLAILKT